MKNTIIEASAGSGKTFRLSNRYIDLICQGVGAENILASTFTVKAAGEILDRILSKLGEAALNEPKFQELKNFVSSCPETKEKLQPIVAKLVRQLYKMRVSTLDSFFNKIASAFSLEIGLPAGWTMVAEDEADQMLTQAVSNVLCQYQNAVKNILAKFQKGETKQSITSELVGIAKSYLALYRATEKKHWIHNNLLIKVLDKQAINDLKLQFEKIELPKVYLTEKGNASTKQTDIIGVPDGLKRDHKKILDAIEAEEWMSLLKTTLCKNVLQGEKAHGTVIEGELQMSIERLGNHAVSVEMNKVVGITEATFDLLELIAKEYEKIAAENPGYRFDDITDKLCNLRKFNLDSSELLSHRLNAPANHLLLDEFQDTSIPQWQVLEPFTKNADSHENSKGSVFVVGDQKQAIYAWRGGVAGIFKKVEDELKPIIEELLTNRRSSKPIIDKVNELFMKIANNPLLNDVEKKCSKYPEYLAAAKEWRSERFEEHSSMEDVDPLKKMPGYFSVEIAAEDANEEESNEDGTNNSNEGETIGSRTDPYSDHVAKRIVTLRQEKPNANIGVLVGRNAEIGKIINSLQNIGVEASEEGGVALTDSNPVQVILSAMKLADHPGDTTALFHLIHSPLRKALELPENVPNQIEDETQKKNAYIQSRRCSTEIRSSIIKNGYGKTIKKYTEWLADSCDERDYEKLKKLTELAYQFDEDAEGVRTQRFLKRVEAARVDNPKAAKIRVMNYFGSKGLEFDIVVLPDFNEPLKKRTPQYIISRDKPAEPVNWVLKYVGQELQAFLPENYQQAFFDRIKNEMIERLCILYVAMTRAKHELLIIVPPKGEPPKKEEQPETEHPDPPKANKKASKPKKETEEKFDARFTGIVFTGLGIEKYTGVTGCVQEHGDKDWYSKSGISRKKAEEKDAQKEEALNCKLGKTKIENQHWVPVAPSSLEAAVVESTPQAGALYREKAAMYGVAMHRCFEAGLKGNWLDDGLKDDTELKELVQEVLITEPNGYTADVIIADFKTNIEKPNVKKILIAPPNNPDVKIEVEAERRFVIRDKGNQRLLHGSIDRLVIHRNKEGKATKIEILDYKTGSQDKLVYVPQMQAYRTAAANLYDIDETNIKTSLVYVDRDEIVEI